MFGCLIFFHTWHVDTFRNTSKLSISFPVLPEKLAMDRWIPALRGLGSWNLGHCTCLLWIICPKIISRNCCLVLANLSGYSAIRHARISYSHMLQNFCLRPSSFPIVCFLMSEVTGKIELDKATWERLYYLQLPYEIQLDLSE